MLRSWILFNTRPTNHIMYPLPMKLIIETLHKLHIQGRELYGEDGGGGGVEAVGIPCL